MVAASDERLKNTQAMNWKTDIILRTSLLRSRKIYLEIRIVRPRSEKMYAFDKIAARMGLFQDMFI